MKRIIIEVPDCVDENLIKEIVKTLIKYSTPKKEEEAFGILKGKDLSKILKEVENEWGYLLIQMFLLGF